MPTYYNEIDPFAAQWLRNLISAGLIPAGDVDERSIAEVGPADLASYTSCHFFAGIGGWAYAGRLARWPDDRPIWTGSCPCQPFSVVGKGGGTSDARHLWPDYFRLISAARPTVVMGEQVAQSAGYGWFDGVRADLEDQNYSCRGVDIPACAVDAPHIRSRIYWIAVADALRERHERGEGNAQGCNVDRAQAGREQGQYSASGCHEVYRSEPFWSDAKHIECHDGKTRRTQYGTPLLAHGLSERVATWRGFGNAIVPQLAAEVIAAFMECDPS